MKYDNDGPKSLSSKGSQIDLCIALPYREPVRLATGSTIQSPNRCDTQSKKTHIFHACYACTYSSPLNVIKN